MARNLDLGGLGKVLGLPLLLAGIALLVWNEYHQKHVAVLFDEAEQSLTALNDTTRINPEYEGCMLYFDATMHIGDTVADPLYGNGGHFLAVNRKVQYRQWVEHQESEQYTDSDGDTHTRTRYYYMQEWADKPVDSEDFHGKGSYRYKNFVLTDISSVKTYSQGASMGPLFLHHQLIDSVPAAPEGSVPLDVDDATFMAAIDSTTHHGAVTCSLMGDTLYYGNHPYAPIVGDVRVVFSYYPSCHVWVMAQQHGDQLRPYQTEDGYWFTLCRLNTKQFEPKDVFEYERSGQKMLRWTLRILGWLMIVWGIKQVFGWFVGFIRRIPILGPVIEAGVGAIAWVIGTLLALLVIGVTFIWVRPWLGFTILGAIIVGLVGGSILYRRTHPVLPPPLPQEAAPKQPTPPPLP